MSLNVELLEQSFDKVKPRANEFAASFYENLFKAHPEVKPLFANTDMGNQEKKLLNSLVFGSRKSPQPRSFRAGSQCSRR
jgi:Hemoglobin-like flavoprotein